MRIGIWSRLFVTAGCVAAAAVAPVTLRGQGASPDGGRKIIAIGCIERNVSSAGTSATKFVLVDRRGEAPTTYALIGDEKELDFHVGHTVEVVASVVTLASADAPMTVKIESLVYLAQRCV